MTATPSSAQNEYVLGTGRDELDRLGFQHQLWSDAAHAAWRAARMNIGSRVLDVGCGPGFASFDMAQLVTSVGSVVGVDESASYIQHVNDQARTRGLPHLRGVVGDVQKLDEAIGEQAGSFDVAYARWVLCFVPNPDAVVAGVAASLKKGGRFCVHDYFNYGSMTMAPKRRSHDRAVAATIASWHARGGDTDIMGKLPRLLDAHGMDVTRLEVHHRIARGTDTMFQWPDVWWRIFAPKLVSMGFLAKEDQEELFRDLDEIRLSRTDFVVTPPVYEIVAVKR